MSSRERDEVFPCTAARRSMWGPTDETSIPGAYKKFFVQGTVGSDGQPFLDGTIISKSLDAPLARASKSALTLKRHRDFVSCAKLIVAAKHVNVTVSVSKTFSKFRPLTLKW